MISREQYLKQIRPFYESNSIKMLLGMRRTGKTTLLKQIKEELSSKGIDSTHIIHLDFGSTEAPQFRNELELNGFILKSLIDEEKFYLLFDEIQNISNFERVLYSLQSTENVSIFLTSSDTNLLSGENTKNPPLQYETFRIMPFTFRESCEIQKITSPDEKALEDYLKWGGMPQLFSIQDEETRKLSLSDLFDSIVYKDAITRYKVKNITLFNRILAYLLKSPAQFFSSTQLIDSFKKERTQFSKETLYNYLSYIAASCVMSTIPRFDLAEKRMLSTLEKYYLPDLAFAQLFCPEERKETLLENLVHNELLARGYKVKVGVYYDSEVNFIVGEGEEQFYIQVAEHLSDEKESKKEFELLKKIKDNYPKYILSLDKDDFSKEGIIHKNLLQWLMQTSIS